MNKLVALYKQLMILLLQERDTIIGMEPTVANNPDLLLPWEFGVLGSTNNIHNVRALCDLCGLTWDDKESLTACVKIESDFDTAATHKNYVISAEGIKVLASTDNGICQWNDVYHGSEITPEQALNDPEMAIRLMCKYFAAGKQNQWVSYSSGAYKEWLGKV